MIESYIDVPALLLLIASNAVPVVATRMLGARFAMPIDAGICLRDGRPLLGPHKTWRGFIAGVLAAGLAGGILTPGFAVGAAFGVLALFGDLASSFVKRRIDFGSGRSAPLLDQLPEALLPLLILSRPLGLTLTEIAGTALAFVALDLLTGQLRPAPAV